MIDTGFIVGVAGVLIAGVSIFFASSQTRAQSRQATEAGRAAILSTNLAMFERVRETRRRLRDIPRVYDEWRAAHPRLANEYDAVGGVDAYYVLREAMDTFQDLYFMRRDGVITDHYWFVWNNTFFSFYAPLATFRNVFEFAAHEGYLHPEFAAWYRPKFDGQPLLDPLARP